MTERGARNVETVLWALTAIMIGTAAGLWHIPLPAPAPTDARVKDYTSVRSRHEDGAASRRARPAPADDLPEIVVGGDPFRLDRSPAPIPYLASIDEVPPVPPEPKPPHPTLALAGIIGGPPWEALVEGIPGSESAVLAQAGSVFGDMRVRTVSQYAVVIEGSDTTWNLILKRPW